MTSIEFFVAMIPPNTTHNDLEAITNKKTGKARIIKSQELRHAESRWEAHLAKFAPTEPMKGAIRAQAKICWPTEGKHYQGEPMTNKPDLDNVEKTLWDVLAKLKFYTDDAHIVDKHTGKMWADPAGIWIRLEEIK